MAARGASFLQKHASRKGFTNRHRGSLSSDDTERRKELVSIRKEQERVESNRHHTGGGEVEGGRKRRKIRRIRWVMRAVS